MCHFGRTLRTCTNGRGIWTWHSWQIKSSGYYFFPTNLPCVANTKKWHTKSWWGEIRPPQSWLHWFLATALCAGDARPRLAWFCIFSGIVQLYYSAILATRSANCTQTVFSLFDDPPAVLHNLTPMSSRTNCKSLLKYLLNAAKAFILMQVETTISIHHLSMVCQAEWHSINGTLEHLTAALRDKMEEHNARWFILGLVSFFLMNT